MKAPLQKKASENHKHQMNPDSSHNAEQSPSPHISYSHNISLQRKPTCPCGGGCPRCHDGSPVQKELSLQRNSANHAESVQPVEHEVLRSPGEPLDPVTRTFFEPRFGHDFSHVRVHTDATAEAAVQKINATAFTCDRHVFFGPGSYNPDSVAGRILIAHELVHVIQQNGQTGGTIGKIGQAGDMYEQAADVAAKAALHGQTVFVTSQTDAPSLQLQQQQQVQTPTREEIEAVIRQGYISEAEQHIAGIDEALTSGYIWWFEREFFTGKTQYEVTALEQRNEALRKLASYLRMFIDALKTGERYWSLRKDHIAAIESLHEGPVHVGGIENALEEFLEEKHGINLDETLPFFPSQPATLGSYVFFGPKKTPVLTPTDPSGAGLAPAPSATRPRPGAKERPPTKKAIPSTKKVMPPTGEKPIAPARQVAPPPAKEAAPPANETKSPGEETKPILNEATPATPSQKREGAFEPPGLITERRDLFVEVLDPEHHPESINGLLEPIQASYYPVDDRGKILKNPPYRFPLFREEREGKRFYYFYKGNKVYLPGLLKQFPATEQYPK